MEETSINPIKYVAIAGLLLMILLAIFLLPLSQTKAQSKGSFSSALAGNTICSAGLGCNAQAQPQAAAPSLNLLSGIFSNSKGPNYDAVISVVNVEGETAVYRIINGRRHSIPTPEVFYSYGFDLNMVSKITKEELEKYPLARLFMAETAEEEEESRPVYYLTEGGLLRQILNDKVFYSYGDRKEDVIFINQKEFNYYPRNQYIFIERPQLSRDIYQITGGIKRYVTPVAVKRLNLKESEIAPVNQVEFDEYPEGESIIY